jgi:hypothetical protein
VLGSPSSTKNASCSPPPRSGLSPKIPWSEDDDRVLGSTRIDRWCYSTSKAVSEHFCFAFEKIGLPITVLRYFNVYGPRLDAIDVGRVITIFLGQALRNEPVTVVGNGTQTRCCGLGDAVAARWRWSAEAAIPASSAWATTGVSVPRSLPADHRHLRLELRGLVRRSEVYRSATGTFSARSRHHRNKGFRG